MKTFIAALVVVLAAPAFGVWEAGTRLPNVCYDTVDGGQFCLDDNLGNVQVFVYNAGWCGPCNDEMRELAPASKQFEGEEVTIASLSGEGYRRGQQPDQAFLQSWKQRHNIPFVVAGKFRDFGQNFNSPGYIPFAVIVDRQGEVVESGFLSATKIVSTVQRLLNSSK